MHWPAGVAEWEEFWTYPRFRAAMRWMTIVWTFGLLAKAATRAVLAFWMPISAFLLVWPFIGHGFTAALIVWSIRYGRRLERQAADLESTGR